MKYEMNISVVIPVYNAAATVRNSVKSLLSQDYEGLEVILVNDGSTDDSGRVCDDLAAEYEEVKVIHKPNGGVSSARNAGLDAASGEYVMFLDSDDVLRQGALRLMEPSGADMVMGGFEKVVDGRAAEVHLPRAKAEYEGRDGIIRFLDDNIGEKDCYMLNSSCFKLYRRELLVRHGHRFDESLSYGEDKIFVFGFLRHVESVVTVPEVVYEYLIQKESLSSDVSSDYHLSQILLLLKSYVPILAELCVRYGSSVRLSMLYHVDVVSRYVFRILSCFLMRPSALMTAGTMDELYAYMKADDRLNLRSVRPAQMLNVILFKSGNVRFSMKFYRFTSSIFRYIPFR